MRLVRKFHMDLFTFHSQSPRVDRCNHIDMRHLLSIGCCPLLLLGGCKDEGGESDAATPADAAVPRDLAMAAPDLQCPGGRSRCGDKCVDLVNDDANCGHCGSACGPMR